MRGEKLKGGSADRVVWGIISPLERGPIDRSFRAIDQGCVLQEFFEFSRIDLSHHFIDQSAGTHAEFARKVDDGLQTSLLLAVLQLTDIGTVDRCLSLEFRLCKSFIQSMTTKDSSEGGFHRARPGACNGS